MSELLSLSGYLKKKVYPNGISYVRREEKAGVLLGLGWFPKHRNGMPKASFLPYSSKQVLENQLESEISSIILEMMTKHPNDWALRTVLRTGWFTTFEDKELREAQKLRLGNLYPKYSLKEMAFLQFSGIENDFDEWISVLREALTGDNSLSYSEAGRLIALGIGPNEFAEISKLPFNIAMDMFS